MNASIVRKKNISDSKQKLIMIVDDDPDQQVMIQMILKNEGYKTILADNGSQFLEEVDKFNPNLVILDVLMPGITLEEILERLVSKKSKPKIMLLTVCRFSQETLDKILKKGNIVAYVKKPFDLDDFILTVKKSV